MQNEEYESFINTIYTSSSELQRVVTRVELVMVIEKKYMKEGDIFNHVC
jgi:hypothetical protein